MDQRNFSFLEWINFYGWVHNSMTFIKHWNHDILTLISRPHPWSNSNKAWKQLFFYLQGTRSSVTTPLLLTKSVSNTVSLTAETWWTWSNVKSSLSWPWLRVMLPPIPMTAPDTSFTPTFSKSTHDPSLFTVTLKEVMWWFSRLTPLMMVSSARLWSVPNLNSAQAGTWELQAQLGIT